MNTAFLILGTIALVVLLSFLSWIYRRKKPECKWRIPWLTILIFFVAIAPPILGIFPKRIQETYIPFLSVVLLAGVCVFADYLAYRYLRPDADRAWNSLFHKRTTREKKNV